MKWLYLSTGAVFALTTISVAFASVPARHHAVGDSALYQSLSEIQVKKAGRLHVDAEIARLNALEGRYQERLPSMTGVRAPMKRIQNLKYRPLGVKKTKRQKQQAGRAR